MGLQRTPPPGRPTDRDAGPSQLPGDTSVSSDSSQAFVPRNPRVMRSPQSGSTLASSSSSRPIPIPTPAPASEPASISSHASTSARGREIPATPAPQYLAPVDEGNTSTTPAYAPPTPAPAPVRAASPIPPPVEIHTASVQQALEQTRPEPITPANKRRKSRHPDPPAPVAQPQLDTSLSSSNGHTDDGASQADNTGMYGMRYQLMMNTLEIAVKRSSHRMTLKEFTKCFPMLAAQNKEMFETVYEETRVRLGEQLLAEASATIEAERFGPALKKIDDAVQEATDNAAECGRPSAWRPEISARAICAAANLPVYDDTYARLRTEYLGLHDDCSKRYTSIAEKRGLLKQLESTVSDGVVDLQKTIETMQDFPTDEMRRWMEDIMPTLDARTA